MNTASHNIVRLFVNAAGKFPQHIAIIDQHASISYRELLRDVEKTAAYFSQKGIGSGDRVLVFVPMGIDLYRIVLALFYIGATAVFLDEWVSKKRLELCCQLADCKGFIGIPKARILGVFSKELRKIPVKLRLKKKATIAIPMANVSQEDSALITFTTGSTGIPKAADRSHSFLLEQFNALLDEIDPKADDIDMTTLPIVLFVNLGVGCTSVIADFKMTKPNSIKPSAIADQLKKHRVNRMTASPFFIRKLAEYSLENNIRFAEITKIFTGGAPVFPNEAAIYSKAFPTTQIMIAYGSTEAEPISLISTNNLLQQREKLEEGLPVGKLYKNTVLRIIGVTKEDIHHCTPTTFDQLELPEGEIGEIVVTGPHVLKRYYKNEAAFQSNKIVVNSTIWHRTGDSGFLKNGELFLTGRCQQLIKREEQYIAPFIIENKLVALEEVSIGTIVEQNNQLFLVVEPSSKQNILQPYLPDLEYDKFIILPQIPRDLRHNSKIDYEELKFILTKNLNARK